MALFSRTNILVLFISTNLIADGYCDNDIIRPPNLTMDNMRAADLLLRGSDEDKSREIDKDIIALRNKIKDIEPDKTLRETIVNSEQQTKDVEGYDKDSNILNFTATDKPLYNIDNDSSTDVFLTTTDFFEDLMEDQTIKSLGDDRIPSFTDEINTQVERSENIADETLDVETTLDATENSIVATSTLSMIDNNVYNERDVPEKDIYNGSFNMNGLNDTPQADSTVTTVNSITRTTQRSLVPEQSLRRGDFGEELDNTGLRSPKTDNSDQKQQIDKRRHEEKPRPSQAATKSATLKAWLEDAYLRPPAGILVPLRPTALNRALYVWKDFLGNEGLNLTDIVIMGYDSNGISWRSRHNLQSTNNNAVSETLAKLLHKYQGIQLEPLGDRTMRALTSAAKLVPYDSALFIITDKGAGDYQKRSLALRALIEKRLKVYTIWTDPINVFDEKEPGQQTLKNVSVYTEGDVLLYPLQTLEEDANNNVPQEDWQNQAHRQPKNYEGSQEFDILLTRKGGGGATSLGLPIENAVTALKVYIEGAVEHAVLYPANEGTQIDLYNQSSVMAFSPLSSTIASSPREVLLVFPGPTNVEDALSVLPPDQKVDSPSTATVGLWRLSVRCDTCNYRLMVTAKTNIHFYTEMLPRDKLSIRVTGPVASLREFSLVDEYGNELVKMPFSYQPLNTESIPTAGDPVSDLMTDVTIPSNLKTTNGRIYAKVVGRDVQGEPFMRLSGPINQQEVRTLRSAPIRFPEPREDELELTEEVNSQLYKMNIQNSTNLPRYRSNTQAFSSQGTLWATVIIGASSKIYGTPGENLQLHFEVTNYREDRLRYNFIATGKLYFLRSISPTTQWIASGQTVNVIVDLVVTTTAQVGAREEITFTAQLVGSTINSISAMTYVYVASQEDQITDLSAPEVSHSIQGTCLGKLGDDCQQHAWSASIVARDRTAGLMQLQSSPVGVQFTNEFVGGTREEVLAVYRANCCNPRVVITATDAFRNVNRYNIDISSYYTPAAIAAIALGILFLIALIILIIFLIYWCVKRRKESRELPYATTSRN